MPRIVFSGWVILGGFLIGALFPQKELISRFILGVLLGVFSLLIYLIYTAARYNFLKKKYGFLRSERAFMDIILQLAAGAAKSDGKVQPKEKNQLLAQLEHAYSTEKANKYRAQFEGYLNQEIPLDRIGKTIHAEFDNSTKGHLLYLLISIVTADGLLTASEEEFIRKVAHYARIRAITVNAVYRLFNFQKEPKHRQEERYQEQHKRTRTSKTNLAKAYDLFGLNANCTDKEIKKAFRQLAKLNHPDKLAHLGEVQLRLAKEKFQKIMEAYEYIKAARGMT